MNLLGLRGIPVGMKVALAPAFTLLCLAIVAAIGYFANSRMTAALSGITEQRLPRIVEAGALVQDLTAVHGQVNQSLAWEGAGIKADVVQALDKRIAVTLAAYEKTLAAAAARPGLGDAQKAALAAATAAFAKYKQSALDALDIKTGMLANAASYMTTMDESFGQVSAQLATVAAAERQLAADDAADADALGARNQWVLAIGFLVALAASTLLSLAVARLIVRPLADAARVAGALAQGDLSAQPAEAPSTDATGRLLLALREVAGGLSAIVLDIRRTADEVSSASQEIGHGTADLSARTEASAAALQQAAASIELLSDAIRSSAHQARDAKSMAHEAAAVATAGGAAVGDVVSAMDVIDEQARRIGEIIGVIDGIAFQTNILALNAAVEAARAGEQGRGFAVVAAEVRTLARRSGDAAREIRGLIGSSAAQVQAGVEKARAAGATMDRIVEGIRRVATTVEQIAQAAEEQAGGIAQISQSVSEMDRSTQQNAALVEQSNAATVSLAQQATQLVATLARFRTS